MFEQSVINIKHCILWIYTIIHSSSSSLDTGIKMNLFKVCPSKQFVCLCWGFTAQSTQWGLVERGQFT